jgi:hypothetical protein
MMTKARLLELLKDVPDDCEVVVRAHDHSTDSRYAELYAEYPLARSFVQERLTFRAEHPHRGRPSGELLMVNVYGDMGVVEAGETFETSPLAHRGTPCVILLAHSELWSHR